MRYVLASATQDSCPRRSKILHCVTECEERLRMRLHDTLPPLYVFTTISEWFNVGQYNKEEP